MTLQNHFLAGKDIREKSFIRPPLKSTSNEQDLCFQIIQMGLYVDPENSNQKYEPQIFGVTEEGHSVLLEVPGFKTHFYIEIPQHWDEKIISTFLNIFVEDYVKNKWCLNNVFHKIELLQPFYGFNNCEKNKYLKLSFDSDKTKKSFIRQFNYPITISEIGLNEHKFVPIEDFVEWELQFLEGANLEASGWIKLPASKYRIIDNPNSSCQYNIRCSYGHIGPAECTKIAPLVIASLDIECIRGSEDGRFPDELNPDDKIIQIATTIHIYGTKGKYKVLHNLRSCDSIEDADVECFDTEAELLEGWRKFWLNVDADIFIGYNIFRFDSMYMFTRSELLGLDSFKYQGRVHDVPTKISSSGITSKAFATNKWKTVPMYGTLQIDVLVYIKKEKNLRSYKLNHVADVFLKDCKEDMPYKLIKPYFDKDSAHRKIVGEYCIKDTLLPIDLLNCEKLKIVESLISMSRISGVPVEFLIMRGQGIKSQALLCRELHSLGMLLTQPPNHKENLKSMRDEAKKEEEENKKLISQGLKPKAQNRKKGYGGAFVLEPKTACYDEPIPTLDFASLYPSIIIAENLCPSTLVTDPRYLGIPGVKYNTIKITDRETKELIAEHTFVTSIEGVTPKVLKKLLAARKVAKREMEDAKESGDMDAYYLKNSNQLSYKLSGNSLYGYYGAPVSKVPCLEVAAGVTQTGREMIEMTRDYVLKTYPGSEVVYGDTDSVMVRFNRGNSPEIFKDTFRLAEEAAAGATKLFKPPHLLEFEKIYYPYYLYDTKKSYAGMLWTKPDKPDYMDVKGLKAIRREPAPFVVDTSNAILKKLMDLDTEGALEILLETLDNMIEDKIPFEKYVIYEGLSKPIEDYKDPLPAHVMLAKKMYDRDPKSAPDSGDRFPYVAIDVGDYDFKKKKGEIIEDPEYVKAHNLTLNILWYIEHQLREPITKLLSLNVDCTTLFDEALSRRKNKQLGINSLSNYFTNTTSQEQQRRNTIKRLLEGAKSKPPSKKPKKAPPKAFNWQSFLTKKSQ